MPLAACEGQADGQSSQPVPTVESTSSVVPTVQVVQVKATPTPTPPIPFTDVAESADYYDAVLWAYKNKVCSDSTLFRPASTCTRGEVITFLWRAKGSPEPKTAKNPLTDIAPSDWYYKAALWAYENQICASATFKPGNTCTNGEVLTFLWRAEGRPMDIVHNRLLARQSGEDTSKNPVTLIWDEYLAQCLGLLSQDKKFAAVVMSKVSEILMLGRSLGSIRLIVSCQRPDAVAFNAGARLNAGVIIVVGSYIRSIYEMLLPEHMDQVKCRRFGRGEGVALFQGSELHFIKVGEVRNIHRMEEICIKALGGKS